MTTDEAMAASSDRLGDGGAGGQGRGQVGRDGVAGADDVDRAAERKRRDVLDRAVGPGADDPARPGSRRPAGRCAGPGPRRPS